jgi:pimeloyl-ACP methyl ester carboxylesterase
VEDGVRWSKPIYLGTMEEMARFNISERLAEITVPTLVTWGDKDTVIPFAAIADIFTNMPHCSLEVWHGVGHSGPIEIPERFMGLVANFIGETMVRA